MKTSHIVVGLGYGDEGKGSWVDHLVRKTEARFVVRFNGGAQAAHHVVTPDGREHTFAQFSSGLFNPGTYSCLSRFMLVEPEALFKEAKELLAVGVENPIERTIVSENAPVIPPANRVLNRMQEMFRAGRRHGSCGFGIGLTQGDVETLGEEALYVRDLKDPERLKAKLRKLNALKVEQARVFLNEDTEDLFRTLSRIDVNFYVDLFGSFYHRVSVLSESDFRRILRENDTVFEGAQGVLLDQHHGFFPHCTRSNCNFKNAQLLLEEAEFDGSTVKTGLLRGYGTRHGAGPFVTENSDLPIPACNNATNNWQGEFRLGWFDTVAARYALELVGGVDNLAITNLDRMRELKTIRYAVRYLGADDRYFSDTRIHTGDWTYSQLSERTSSMAGIQPVYCEFPGFGTSARKQSGYLERLEEELTHRVHAFSETAGPEKGYR